MADALEIRKDVPPNNGQEMIYASMGANAHGFQAECVQHLPFVIPPILVDQEPPAELQQEGNDSTLYICKDNFEAINPYEADQLKDFIVAKIFEQTAQTGSCPNFHIGGLNSLHRYEFATDDEVLRNWLINLDFSKFQPFNVLVYNKEELWYERAAVWLPGHSRCRAIDPLTKLQLQNKHLNGVNLGKWKMVKKIVTVKGTRIYVDMPPSSARAVEEHKMMLSYELSKVNVFLKALAVDKNAFDRGLLDASVQDETVIIEATLNSPIPNLPDEKDVIKICLKGNKLINPDQARKIKEMIIYHLFKYLQNPTARLKTDFVKYGFCRPGYFAVLPENSESSKWLKSLDIGKLNRHEVVIVGADDMTKYFRLSAKFPYQNTNQSSLAFDRLRQVNKGVKKINFTKWKILDFTLQNGKYIMDLEIDLESLETLVKMELRLHYVNNERILFTHEYENLDVTIKAAKAEMVDSYQVADMEIESGDDDVDDIIILD